MIISIGIIASVILLYQASYLFVSFMWALIHGMGASSFFAFWPALVALTALWCGYAFFRHKKHQHGAISFLIYALLLTVIFEIVLPATPLKTIIRQRAIKDTKVQNIRDEALLSKHGNPVGIRIQYDVEFPKSGIYTVSPSVSSPTGKDINLVPYQMQFGHEKGNRIEPQPSFIADESGGFFEKGIVYHFTIDQLPNFLSYDERKKAFRFEIQPTKHFSEFDFNSAISKSSKTKYRTEIQIEGGGHTQRVVAQNYVTSHEYDLKTFYDSVIKEGGARRQF